MPDPKRTLVFAFGFLVIYGLLITPWPGLKPFYARYFQALGRAVFGDNGSRRTLEFQPLDNHGHVWPPNFDTAIIMGNRDWRDATGQSHRYLLTVDAWQMGWTPTAFLTALTLATPLPWRRRLGALFRGSWLIHGFILLTLGIFLWNESTRLGLVMLSPFWKGVANQLEQLALNPVGPSFFVATLIWVLVTFRRRDLRPREDPDF